MEGIKLGKKLEIQLSNTLYIKMKEESKNKNISLEDYILEVLTKNQQKDIEINRLKEIIINDMRKMIIKIQEMNTNTKYNRKELKFISLKDYDGQIPEGLKEKINFFKNIECLYEKYFFMILRQGKIIGSVGLSFHDEPLPYGQYAFIYYLNVEKPYFNFKQLKEVVSFLQSTAKKKNVYNIDIMSTTCKLENVEFKKLGFMNLSDVNHTRAIIKDNIQEDMKLKYTWEYIKVDIQYLKDFLIVNRKFPLSQVYRYLLGNIKSMECNKIIYGNNIEAYIIHKKTKGNRDKLHCPMIFLKPIILYDREVLKDIYRILISNMKFHGMGNSIVIDIPIELEDTIKSYMEYKTVKRIIWYRNTFS